MWGWNGNGIQLSSNGLLYQLITQHMTWFRHEGILLRSPLLDTGFDPIGTRGVDKYLLPGHSTVGFTEPPQGLDPGVGHFRPLSITRQRHWLAYHFIAMRHADFCQVF